MNALNDAQLELVTRLSENVLAPMKQVFVGKDEIIDLLGIGLVARENVFLLGPPGTAKSALVQELARRIDGRVFDYLLTRFTEPNEIFGPFDIRKLRDGDLVTNTEGMLPEAAFVFLDELLNANSAILNSLLMALNERVFRRGRETYELPALMIVGASNRLPEDEALGALFDRFLLRVHCDNVPHEELAHVLVAGWKLDVEREAEQTMVSVDDVRNLQSLLGAVDLSEIRTDYTELIHRLRHAGIMVSDRRAVKIQRLMAASALLCSRLEVNHTDFWVLRYVWDSQEQQEVLATIVGDAVERASEEEKKVGHPRALGNELPDPEMLAQDLALIASKVQADSIAATDRSYLRDQLGLLAARCQWVADAQQRDHLQTQVDSMLSHLEEEA